MIYRGEFRPKSNMYDGQFLQKKFHRRYSTKF